MTDILQYKFLNIMFDLEEDDDINNISIYMNKDNDEYSFKIQNMINKKNISIKLNNKKSYNEIKSNIIDFIHKDKPFNYNQYKKYLSYIISLSLRLNETRKFDNLKVNFRDTINDYSFLISEDYNFEIPILDTLTIDDLRRLFFKRIEYIKLNNKQEICNICVEDIKHNIICNKCSNNICGFCYINIIKINNGLFKCPYCKFTYGKEAVDEKDLDEMLFMIRINFLE